MTTVTPATDRVASILEAACRVVTREGAHGLRMASVAEEAGVSKALVHYYFSTRKELMRSAFAWSEQQWERALTEEIAELGSGAEKLERVLLRSIDPKQPFSHQRALWNEVWSSLRYDDTLRPLVDASYRAWLDWLAELVDAGRKDGSVPASVDPTTTAWRLAAAGDGLDSMLYLGLLDREQARELMTGTIALELVAPTS
ncbi:MAG TPA: TetR family transcriptional regulator C-terminal domain-containing protein [Gaiellaceae bacterium]|nr:TetR family transcriptional regulator C-terminal domain-containing protein [Gaiellaceae bacterium]